MIWILLQANPQLLTDTTATVASATAMPEEISLWSLLNKGGLLCTLCTCF
jgi:hypothetical protein